MLQTEKKFEDKILLLEAKIEGIQKAATGFIKINFLITKGLRNPLDAVVEPDDNGFIARSTDMPLYGFGDDPIEAVQSLKYEIESVYDELAEDDEFSQEWLLIKDFLKSRIIG